MKHLFVTGASSGIGRRVVAGLAGDHRLTLLVHHRRPVVPAGAAVELVEGGLEGIVEHCDAVRSADLVLHMAGLSHSDREEAYREVNVEGTRRMVRACRGDQPVVYLSTRCADEAAGAYGRSKAAAEAVVRESGRPFVLVRPGEVYGSKAGEGIDGLVALARRLGLVVDFRWTPPVSYSPVSVGELSELLVALVRRGRFEGQVYTVTNRRGYSAREMRDALAAGWNRRLFLLPIPVRALMVARGSHLPMPFAEDQLARLVLPKALDDGRCVTDLGFAPVDFLDWLRAGAETPVDRSGSGGGASAIESVE